MEKKILSYRIYIYNLGGIFILRTLKICYMPVFVCLQIFVLNYLVQIQIIQNQFKISEGGKWNSHQMSCVYSSRMVKNYRICPIYLHVHIRMQLTLKHNFEIVEII
jgi:hypothetical protein